MTRTYNGLKDTILDCQAHFDVVLRRARTVFTSADAGRALDEWMLLVIGAAREIRDFYAKSSLGKDTSLGSWRRTHAL